MAEVGRARAIALLIGSYDGSGNYGDIAQLDAALALLERFDPDLLVLPVLERSRLDDHLALVSEFLHKPPRALFFDPGEDHQDDLQPVATPANLAFAASYMYGGGYLNAAWGERKLAMLHAAETLFAESGPGETCRISSGLQVEADWLETLSPTDAEALRAFEPLGVRDRASGEALVALDGEASIRETGDDVVGLLRPLQPTRATAGSNGRLHVNLHVAEHPWVTDRGEEMVDFHVDLLAALASRADRQIVVRPLLAYADRWVNERQALERLTAACTARGIELAEARVLRPAGLADELQEMARAALTVSCSYHVALTSLLLEIPTVLLCDNAYYRQKAAGLAEAFGLPDAFTPASSADPVAAAHEIADLVFDEPRAAALGQRLHEGASHLRGMRATTEVELLARLGSAATAALIARLAEASERLREHSEEPAKLQAQLALLQNEESPQPPAESPSAEARQSAAEETLAELLGSRSWRMTAPLRRLTAPLRRQR